MFALAGSVAVRDTDTAPTTAPTTSPPAAAVHVDDTDRVEMLELRRAARARASADTASAAPASATASVPAPVVAAEKPPKAAPARKQRVETAPAAGRAATVVAYARAQVGKRYVFGTAGPNTFDCSGLVKAAYARVGVALPHYTGTLAGRGRAVSRAHLAPGDLVFPSSGHVGIYIGGGQIVHASTPRGGVKLSGIYKFSFARRIL